MLSIRVACFFLFALVMHVSGHGMLHDPPARSTAWRYDNRFPAEYTDNQMFCGGVATQWAKNGELCFFFF